VPRSSLFRVRFVSSRLDRWQTYPFCEHLPLLLQEKPLQQSQSALQSARDVPQQRSPFRLHLLASRPQMMLLSLHWHSLFVLHRLRRPWQAAKTSATPPRVRRPPMPTAAPAWNSRRRPVLVEFNLTRESNVLSSTYGLLFWRPWPPNRHPSPRISEASGRHSGAAANVECGSRIVSIYHPAHMSTQRGDVPG
jgi:hypothetical protein